MMRRYLPFFQLIRLPNVFTALADICLAGLAVRCFPEHTLSFLLLLLASSCFYCSGMVWNDIFDLEQDKKERPFRPLPSGQISVFTAILLAGSLMAIGLVLSLAVDLLRPEATWFTIWIAVLLCACIFLYDGLVKSTWAGPLFMGGCRFFNVLLGLSLVSPWVGWEPVLALVVGIYIVGVTWFARTEAGESQKLDLICAVVVMLLGILLSLVLPVIVPFARHEETNLPLDAAVWWGHLLFPYLLIAFIGYLALPLFSAIGRPTPSQVQQAVKRSILGLILLDALLAAIFVGPMGLLIALLLVPSFWLGRWVYST